MTNMLDEIDKKVLKELQENADRKLHDLEKTTRIARTTIFNRQNKLKKLGVIKKIKAVVEPSKIGLNVCALVHIVVSFKAGVHEVAKKIASLPNVEEVYMTVGVFDIIAKVRFKNNEELSKFIFDDKTGIKAFEGVERTESMICVETIKENGILIPQ